MSTEKRPLDWITKKSMITWKKEFQLNNKIRSQIVQGLKQSEKSS